MNTFTPIGQDTMPYLRKRNSIAAKKGWKLYRFGVVRLVTHYWNTWRR